MKQPIKAQHWFDSDGKPAGGVTQGTGLLVSWQNGPLGRGEERRAPSGAFVETVIAAAIGRLEFYQRSQFACQENAAALDLLLLALAVLEERTSRREAAGIEGTHEGS